MAVYWVLDLAAKRVKVGHSKHPLKRLNELRTANPNKLTLVGVSKHIKEKDVHKAYKKFHIKGEWFEWNDLTSTYCWFFRDHFLSRKYLDVQRGEEFDAKEQFMTQITEVYDDYADFLKHTEPVKGED